MKTNLKSLFLKLEGNDYVKIFVETAIGGVAGYVLPILYGTAVFSMVNAKAALIGAVLMGLRKAVTLFITNSNGKVLVKEIPTVKVPDSNIQAQPTEVKSV